MRAGIRLLLSNAAMLACLADTTDDREELDSKVIELIADALSIAIHLGDGSHLMSSAAASASMAEVVDFAENTLRDRSVGEEAIDLLEERSHDSTPESRAGVPPGTRCSGGVPHDPDAARIEEAFGRGESRRQLELRTAGIRGLLSLDAGTPEGGLPDIVPAEYGDLFSMEDVIFLDEAKLEILARPHRRLIELLEMVDVTEPVPTSRLQALGDTSLARMSELIDTLSDEVDGGG